MKLKMRWGNVTRSAIINKKLRTTKNMPETLLGGNTGTTGKKDRKTCCLIIWYLVLAFGEMNISIIKHPQRVKEAKRTNKSLAKTTLRGEPGLVRKRRESQESRRSSPGASVGGEARRMIKTT